MGAIESIPLLDRVLIVHVGRLCEHVAASTIITARNRPETDIVAVPREKFDEEIPAVLKGPYDLIIFLGNRVSGDVLHSARDRHHLVSWDPDHDLEKYGILANIHKASDLKCHPNIASLLFDDGMSKLALAILDEALKTNTFKSFCDVVSAIQHIVARVASSPGEPSREYLAVGKVMKRIMRRQAEILALNESELVVSNETSITFCLVRTSWDNMMFTAKAASSYADIGVSISFDIVTDTTRVGFYTTNIRLYEFLYDDIFRGIMEGKPFKRDARLDIKSLLMIAVKERALRDAMWINAVLSFKKNKTR